ncbi:MAG: lyase family protein, partial [Planctomycetota bacterium]
AEEQSKDTVSYPTTGARTFGLTAQTYPRVLDANILGFLANIASVLHKIATDIRLLCNLGEVSEPFETKQIGSSAMPYKRNPMRCERVCGLTRFVWNLVPNAYDTAATQWLERTLDDSSNRRLVLPEGFLALDAALNIMHNVISGLVVHEKVIARNLERELPFLATEAMMMAAVKQGADRQDVHEVIRQHAMAAKHRMVEGDGVNDLVERLKGEPLLKDVDIDAELEPKRHIGLAVEQTERFLREVIEPLREQMGENESAPEELRV